MSKRIAFPVTNDLNYDQRMQRICGSLAKGGYQVQLIGRLKPDSIELKEQPFEQHRLTLWFSSGKLFYLQYNLWLFFYLLSNKWDAICAIDLDSMLACYLASRIKRVPLLYDAHEYFAQLPEIVERPMVMKVWKSLEKYTVPKCDRCYTINQSYADLFKKEYDQDFEIIRNATALKSAETFDVSKREDYILYQGAVNVGRGVEEMIEAMQYIDCHLYICGKGDQFQYCVDLVEKLGLESKVKFLGYVEPKELRKITEKAKLGFTLFTDDGESYIYSLANRFFDYFHSGVPQLAIDFPEYRRIVEQFKIGKLVQSMEPEALAQAANEILSNQDLWNEMHDECLKARAVYNWQEEEKKLLKIYATLWS